MNRQSVSRNSRLLYYLGWDRFNIAKLAKAEKLLFENVQENLITRNVSINFQNANIYTVSVAEDKFPSDKIPFVILHGIGGAVGFWGINFDDFAQYRPVYAIDLLGFGRSSRIPLSSDAEEAELEWIKSIEEWRIAMKIEKMILIGHSLGGYLAAAYALKYPKNIRHLVLIEPWGFVEKPKLLDPASLSWWRKPLKNFTIPTFILWMTRICGPFGKRMLHDLFPDLPKRQQILDSKSDAVYEYFYQINAQNPTGEAAFKTISEFGYAKYPLIHRFPELDPLMQLTFIFGKQSACTSASGFEVKEMRLQSYCNVEVIEDVGHHPHIDKKEQFNLVINDLNDKIENNQDI